MSRKSREELWENLGCEWAVSSTLEEAIYFTGTWRNGSGDILAIVKVRLIIIFFKG